jgi:Reticulon
LKPRQYYQVNKYTFESLFNETANLINFLVLEFQRLLFAEKISHTVVAFIVSFISYNLVQFIPLWSLVLVGTILAFGLPPLYLRNQQLIDKHISQAQHIAAEKVNYAKDIAGERVATVSERAKLVTSEWGKRAGVELPWSPKSTTSAAPHRTPTKPVAARATGVETLKGINVPQGVPQGTPEKKIDPAKVPLPDTPAPVAGS